jgi:GR25 family glycosyltransferase involved in LPS biosynthesis
MIPSICIYLPEQSLRMEETKSHFDAQGIKPCWFPGFNGSLIGFTASHPHDHDALGRAQYMHPVQLSLALSHIAALSMAVAIGWEEWIIFEDDAILVDEFEKKFVVIRSTIPEHIGCVQLEHMDSAKKNKKGEPDPTEHKLVIGKYPFCCAAIWWRLSAAKEALRLLRPVNSPFDIMLINRVYPFIGHAAVNPPLVTQRTQTTGEWRSLAT